MMTVLHPNDRSTDVLKGLYEGLEVQQLDETLSNNEIKHLLNERNYNHPLMLLGHGSAKGLFSRKDDTLDFFDRLIINHQHRFYLKKQHYIIGIWCHANEFAMQYHLNGLFTGMFISEMDEAKEYHIETTEEEIQTELVKFVKRLRSLLDEHMHYSKIPDRLKEMDDIRSPLTVFNYNSIFYMHYNLHYE